MKANESPRAKINQPQVEQPKYIDITRNTIRFGRSVYQFKNVTGFSAGRVPRGKFPWILFLILVVIGLVLFSSSLFLAQKSIGFVLLAIAGIWAYSHFAAPSQYALALLLNSGEAEYFISSDQDFLNEAVRTLYSFMEEEIEQTITIDMSNRSINVSGDFHGSATTGNDNYRR